MDRIPKDHETLLRSIKSSFYLVKVLTITEVLLLCRYNSVKEHKFLMVKNITYSRLRLKSPKTSRYCSLSNIVREFV